MRGPGRRGRRATVGQSATSSSLRGSSVDLHPHETRTSGTIDNFDVDKQIVAHSTIISNGTKKRGRTRNVALSRRKNENEKLTVDIPNEEEKKCDVGSIELYKLTHCRCEEGSDEGSWVSDIAKDNHRKMLEYKRERQAGGENPVDEEKICAEILGDKSGYVHGRGAGPKPSSSLSDRSYREELDEAKRNARIAQERAEKAEQQVLVFSKQLENQKNIIDDLKEGLVATQRAMVENKNPQQR
ncbi:hypothetical protein BUALT_Bualt16G0096200 [Buddleja alternifolia]|uniref:Uncharacterized protein n=1 Tax=Buddleja alternifolia TaxID=168488 RepID=A0AAV6W888_9LAMI|nr:hypothetical protein BUALT_Bualt16G0096200 [Buddleja alternifolia]